jgi:hypothetical protein
MEVNLSLILRPLTRRTDKENKFGFDGFEISIRNDGVWAGMEPEIEPEWEPALGAIRSRSNRARQTLEYPALCGIAPIAW